MENKVVYVQVEENIVHESHGVRFRTVHPVYDVEEGTVSFPVLVPEEVLLERDVEADYGVLELDARLRIAELRNLVRELVRNVETSTSPGSIMEGSASRVWRDAVAVAEDFEMKKEDEWIQKKYSDLLRETEELRLNYDGLKKKYEDVLEELHCAEDCAVPQDMLDKYREAYSYVLGEQSDTVPDNPTLEDYRHEAERVGWEFHGPDPKPSIDEGFVYLDVSANKAHACGRHFVPSQLRRAIRMLRTENLPDWSGFVSVPEELVEKYRSQRKQLTGSVVRAKGQVMFLVGCEDVFGRDTADEEIWSAKTEKHGRLFNIALNPDDVEILATEEDGELVPTNTGIEDLCREIGNPGFRLEWVGDHTWSFRSEGVILGKSLDSLARRHAAIYLDAAKTYYETYYGLDREDTWWRELCY